MDVPSIAKCLIEKVIRWRQMKHMKSSFMSLIDTTEFPHHHPVRADNEQNCQETASL
jgi:hypothetical protein